ncbi:F-box protein [Phanerochaete sordida]|uniref:F-box protein n=1 Tax=Phanerochaete sordida TaxID=48140 RepID=A0A9P3GFX4_9APHY|nr:F-box protein [Phanerochaete sordida]
MAMFTDLPNELCEAILSALNPVVIARFQRVCRAARALVRSSVALQYKLACFRAGVVDCPAGLRSSTAERLVRVRGWHAAWKRPRWRHIHLPPLTAHPCTSGPVFAQRAAQDPTSIAFFLLGSPLRSAGLHSWTLTGLPEYITFAFDWYLDLLVVVERTDARHVTLHFLTCTTGHPHPLAASPSTCVALSDDLGNLKLVIGGSLVLCQHISRYGRWIERWVFDWRGGSLLLSLVTTESDMRMMGQDSTLLDSRYLLVTVDVTNDAKSPVLAVFDCYNVPRDRQLTLPADIGSASILLDLPLLDWMKWAAIYRVDCRPFSHEALPKQTRGFAFRPVAPPIVHVSIRHIEHDWIRYDVLIPAMLISICGALARFRPLLPPPRLSWKAYASRCRVISADDGVVQGHRHAMAAPAREEHWDDVPNDFEPDGQPATGGAQDDEDSEDSESGEDGGASDGGDSSDEEEGYTIEIRHFAWAPLVRSDGDVDNNTGEVPDGVEVHRIVNASSVSQECHFEEPVPTAAPYLKTWTGICAAEGSRLFLVEDGIVVSEGSKKPMRAYII